MKSPCVLLAITTAVVWLSASAQAYPYKWVDKRGGVHYSQFPPPPGIREESSNTSRTGAKAKAASTQVAFQRGAGGLWDTSAYTRWETHMSVGTKAFEERRDADAAKSLEAAVKEAEHFGSEDRRLGASLGLLARTYEHQGQHAKAEPLYQRSIAVLERALGPEGVTQELINLVQLYLDQDKYAQAEPLYRRLPPNTDAAAMLHNLARFYERQGQHAKAEPLYRHRVALLEKAVGPADPRLGVGLIDLGKVYAKQAKHAQAEPHLRRALGVQENALGPEHPNVAATLDSLATVYRDQGKYAEAEPLYKRAVAVYGKTVGPEHPNVAGSLGRYALLLRRTQRDAEAATMEARAKAILAKSAGRS